MKLYGFAVFKHVAGVMMGESVDDIKQKVLSNKNIMGANSDYYVTVCDVPDKLIGQAGYVSRDVLSTVGLESLVGPRMLSGCDTVARDIPDSCNAINFVLDGKTYTAIEDENDGYRSCLDEIYMSNDTLENNFAPVAVLGVHDTNKCDIVRFYDVKNGNVILEVGTENTDDYYPKFVGNFYPDKMFVNKAVL